MCRSDVLPGCACGGLGSVTEGVSRDAQPPPRGGVVGGGLVRARLAAPCDPGAGLAVAVHSVCCYEARGRGVQDARATTPKP